MQIVVCVKQVPDSESKITVSEGRIDESGFSFILNPYDEYAIEEAVRLKLAHGGKVTLVSLGSADSQLVVKNGLALGADEAVILKDEGYHRFNGDAAARQLAAAIEPLNPDIVLCGQSGIDYNLGLTGPALAEHLGIPHITYIQKLEVADGTATAHRQVEGGHEVVSTVLPALFTTQKGLNEPRFPSLMDIMKAKKKPMHTPEAAPGGEPTATIASARLPPARTGGYLVQGADTAEKVAKLIEHLKTDAKVI